MAFHASLPPLLLLFALLWWPHPCSSLVIENPLSGGEPSVYEHMNANFGPQHFDREGPLVLSAPTELLCGGTITANATGRVVLVERGNCTFVEKVLTAQKGGAIGVVVGNDPRSENGFVSMSAGSDGSDVKIPAVFVLYDTYNTLRQQLESNDTILLATLNEKGQVVVEGFQTAFKIMGVLLLLVPLAWCALMLCWMIRKCITDRISRIERSNRTRFLPLVSYRRLPDEEKGETRSSALLPAQQQRIHNESCAICLEDFSDGSSIKLLPCSHGFHANCIDPWLTTRSELCPICKQSILDTPTNYATAVKARCLYCLSGCRPAISVVGGSSSATPSSSSSSSSASSSSSSSL